MVQSKRASKTIIYLPRRKISSDRRYCYFFFTNPKFPKANKLFEQQRREQDSMLSLGTKEMNWPSIFDQTDILILKRCFQRCDMNAPDLSHTIHNENANSRHRNRCIPQRMDVEKKCTTEAFQNFVNDYIARFMPADELKKFINKSPLKGKGINIEETTSLGNKYRKQNDMKAKG